MAHPEPLVSIVTAAFRAREALEPTIASVAGQTFSGLEHVVIDGGSDDGTREMLQAQGAQVRWISEPDQGIADALNKGVAMARGEWILVLQAGDSFLSPTSVESAAPYLDDSAMVGFAVQFIHPDGQQRTLHPHPFGPLTELRVLNPHQGLFCRRKVFEKIGMFDPQIRVGMDYDHLLRAKHAGFELKVVDEVLSIMPADGVSSRDDWQGRRERLAEQFRIQWKNAPNAGIKMGLLGFWAMFYPAYVAKNLVAPRVRLY